VTAIHLTAPALAATSSTYCGCVIAATQRVWAAKYSTSGPALFVLVVTATAPSSAQANQLSTISGQLSVWTSTLSPFTTPRSARPAAMFFASARKAP
jgi:hypothetical protein